MFNNDEIISLMFTLTPVIIFFGVGFIIHNTQKTGRLFLNIGELESYKNFVKETKLFLNVMWTILFLSAMWNMFNILSFIRG